MQATTDHCTLQVHQDTCYCLHMCIPLITALCKYTKTHAIAYTCAVN